MYFSFLVQIYQRGKTFFFLKITGQDHGFQILSFDEICVNDIPTYSNTNTPLDNLSLLYEYEVVANSVYVSIYINQFSFLSTGRLFISTSLFQWNFYSNFWDMGVPPSTTSLNVVKKGTKNNMD